MLTTDLSTKMRQKFLSHLITDSLMNENVNSQCVVLIDVFSLNT